MPKNLISTNAIPSTVVSVIIVIIYNDPLKPYLLERVTIDETCFYRYNGRKKDNRLGIAQEMSLGRQRLQYHSQESSLVAQYFLTIKKLRFVNLWQMVLRNNQ